MKLLHRRDQIKPTEISRGQVWRDSTGCEWLVVSVIDGRGYDLQFVSGKPPPAPLIAHSDPSVLLKDPSWTLVSGPSRSFEVFKGLVRALRHKDPDKRMDAADALGAWGDARAVEPLIAALADEERGVRLEAAQALGKLGDGQAQEPLIGALDDEDNWVRSAAVEALKVLGDARAVDPLIATLDDPDFYVRRMAAEALGHLADSRAVDPLVRALGDESFLVRVKAAAALKLLGPLPHPASQALAPHLVTEALLRTLLDRRREMREWQETQGADYAPGDLGPLGKEYGELSQGLRAAVDDAVQAVRELGRPVAVEDVLRAALRDGSDERWAAGRAAEALDMDLQEPPSR